MAFLGKDNQVPQVEGGKSMTTRPHPESERPLHGALQSFDLAAEVTRLREEKA
jgi:hypothetical protein